MCVPAMSINLHTECCQPSMIYLYIECNRYWLIFDSPAEVKLIVSSCFSSHLVLFIGLTVFITSTLTNSHHCKSYQGRHDDQKKNMKPSGLKLLLLLGDRLSSSPLLPLLKLVPKLWNTGTAVIIHQ